MQKKKVLLVSMGLLSMPDSCSAPFSFQHHGFFITRICATELPLALIIMLIISGENQLPFPITNYEYRICIKIFKRDSQLKYQLKTIKLYLTNIVALDTRGRTLVKEYRDNTLKKCLEHYLKVESQIKTQTEKGSL